MHGVAGGGQVPNLLSPNLTLTLNQTKNQNQNLNGWEEWGVGGLEPSHPYSGTYDLV